MSQTLFKLTLPILLSLNYAIAFSATTLGVNKQNVNTFIPPKLIKRTSPNYPIEELYDGNVGTVEIAFMVDKSGKTFEPVILRSSKPTFEPYALLALRTYHYQPATLNGQPVDSVKRVRIVFLVEHQKDQVGRQFAKHYKSAQKELKKQKPNKRKVVKKIKSMENSNELSPYSYLLLNNLKYTYASLFLDKQSQIDSIYELLLFEAHINDSNAALDNNLRVKMRRLLVSLLIQTGQYGTALLEQENLKEIDPKADILFQGPLKEMEKIRTSSQLISRTLILNKQGFNSTYLFKNSFGFLSGASKIKQLKLRCSHKFKVIDYKPDSEYKVPKEWGEECYIHIIGEPESDVEFYQL